MTLSHAQSPFKKFSFKKPLTFSKQHTQTSAGQQILSRGEEAWELTVMAACRMGLPWEGHTPPPAQTGKTRAVSHLQLPTCPKVLREAELSCVGPE